MPFSRDHYFLYLELWHVWAALELHLLSPLTHRLEEEHFFSLTYLWIWIKFGLTWTMICWPLAVWMTCWPWLVEIILLLWFSFDFYPKSIAPGLVYGNDNLQKISTLNITIYCTMYMILWLAVGSTEAKHHGHHLLKHFTTQITWTIHYPSTSLQVGHHSSETS